MSELRELFNHECEVCGKKEVLTLEEGFNEGWDMPPRMGAWGMISPRTCGDCGIDKTVYWHLLTQPETPLTEDQMKTIERIQAETGIPDVVEEIR